MSDIVRAPESEKLVDFLGRYRGQIKDILSKDFDQARFAKLIIAQINKTPALLSCTPISVLNSVLHAASMGLEIRANSAYLLPYGNQCQLIIDYRGKLDLAIKSGRVSDIEARLVYEQDSLEIEFGLSPIFRHVPNYEAEDRGQVRLGYAIAWLKGLDRPHIEPMTFAEIEHVRNKSRSKNNGPWVTDWPQMARKTLIHRIYNYLPQTREMAQSQEIDDAQAMDLPMPPMVVPESREDEENPILECSKEKQIEVMEQQLVTAGIEPDEAARLAQERREKITPKGKRPTQFPKFDDFPPVEQIADGQKLMVKGKLYEFVEQSSSYRPLEPVPF